MAQKLVTTCDAPDCKKETQNWQEMGWIHVTIKGGFIALYIPSNYNLCSYVCLENLVNQWSNQK